MASRKTKRHRKSSRPKTRSRRTGSGDKLPKDAVTLVVVLRAREGQETLLEAELRALAGPSRKEPGCFGFDVYRAVDPPAGFLLHEVWASRDAHGEHTRTPHFLRWNARKDALISSRDGTFWKRIV